MAKTAKTSKTDSNKIDLFQALDKLNSADIDFFSKLTSAEKKSLAPVVIMRWLSGSRDKKQIVRLNHLVNPLVFNMYQHQDLLFKLMMASSNGTPQRFRWIKKNTLNKKQPLRIELIKQYYYCSTLEARQYLPLLSIDDLVAMAEELGQDCDSIEKLKKEE